MIVDRLRGCGAVEREGRWWERHPAANSLPFERGRSTGVRKRAAGRAARTLSAAVR